MAEPDNDQRADEATAAGLPRVLAVSDRGWPPEFPGADVKILLPDSFTPASLDEADPDLLILDAAPRSWPLLARAARAARPGPRLPVLATPRGGAAAREFRLIPDDTAQAAAIAVPLAEFSAEARRLFRRLRRTEVLFKAEELANREAVDLLLELDQRDGIIRRQKEQIEEQVRRIRGDLDLAARVQTTLLPRTPEDFPGLRFAAVWHPADELGGDYYDFLRPGAGAIDLVVADVAGHGAAAALVGVQVRTMLHSALERASGLQENLASVNRTLADTFSGRPFVTLFYARFRPGEDRVEYANAGHPPAVLLRRGGELIDLPAGSPPLGIQRDADPVLASVDFREGDRLLIFTDGLIEPVDGKGEAFGLPSLKAMFALMCREDGGQALAAMIDTVKHHAKAPLPDDVTAVMVDRTTQPAGRRP
jgi:serine phosphatase RsbU (regulator of sigma subunit)